MASPSWLPSWPTGWPDYEEIYKSLFPDLLPRNLYHRDTEPWHDWVAIGETLAQVRKALHWAMECYFPQRDFNGLFLERWEKLLALGKRASVADRQAWVGAKLRQTGTNTVDMFKNIMAGAWERITGDSLTMYTPTAAINATYPQPTDELQYRHNNYAHFYDTAEGAVPDAGMGAEYADWAKATWEYVTFGRYEVMQYDDTNSGWDYGRWGDEPY